MGIIYRNLDEVKTYESSFFGDIVCVDMPTSTCKYGRQSRLRLTLIVRGLMSENNAMNIEKGFTR